MKKLILLTAALVLFGCGEQPKEDNSGQDAALAAAANNLKVVESDFVPESISEDGSLTASSVPGKVHSKGGPEKDDICKDLDFIECQPRLIRAYMKWGRFAVALTHKLVFDVAVALKDTPDDSNGSVNLPEEKLTVQYNKTSLKVFEFLILTNNQPAGYVKANDGEYHIQLDISLLEKNDPNSKGGKVDIAVNFTDKKNWTSKMSITEALCDTLEPDAPESIVIDVQRQDGIWKGQTLLYNGISTAAKEDQSCDLAANDDDALTVYTEFAANRQVAKAGMFLMKRTKNDVSDIANFGINNYCDNYADLCQKLADEIGSTPALVDAYLNGLQNPYCMQRGSRDVTFNSDCSSHSEDIGSASFLPNSNWITPFDFYQMTIDLPNQL